METTQILPVLDLAALQEKANEFAMKGAIETLKEFYSGYNSPYRKALDESLKDKGVSSGSLQIPDIIAVLNESISKEIDLIANTSIAATFIPQVKKFFTREEAEMSFYDFLKEIVDLTDGKEIEDYDISVKESSHGWLDISLQSQDKNYQMTLHEDWETRKEPVKKYMFLSLPNDHSDYKRTMKLSVEGATLEMPFTRDVLADDVHSFIARLVISRTKFTMNVREFQEEMFPDSCHCH